MEERRVETVQDLREAIEALFVYSGSFDRAWMEPAWCDGRVVAETFALRANGRGCEPRLLAAMYEAFMDAKRTLGWRDDVGIVWRRAPHLVTEDDGTVVLRVRAALVDRDGQIKVSGMPVKAEGVPSRSID